MNNAMENLPYLYQYEYLNNAWGRVHNGYFIDPKGNRYNYDNPKDWKHTTVVDFLPDEQDSLGSDDLIARILVSDGLKPEELFANLGNSVKRTGLLTLFKKKLELSIEIL
jgi:hypothetical protein